MLFVLPCGPAVHKRILDILPGVSGGVARIMVGQPFDTIKTRLQVLGKGTIGAAGMPPEMVYNNGMDCVRKMVSGWSDVPRARQKGPAAQTGKCTPTVHFVCVCEPAFYKLLCCRLQPTVFAGGWAASLAR